MCVCVCVCVCVRAWFLVGEGRLNLTLRYSLRTVLNLGSDVLLWMSDGKLFHRIIGRGKKLVSVDDFFTAGTGYM